jgi:hypothetical protein
MAIDLTNTYLNTVNFLLEVMGSPPVGSVDVGNLPPDVAIAVARINEESLALQLRGWWFNRNYSQEFTPDGSDLITLPNNCIKVTRYYTGALVLRGRKLYDPVNNTYEFECPVTLDWVEALDWDDLPACVQEQIKYIAASSICITNLEDMGKAQQYSNMSQGAHIQMVEADLEANQYNALATPAALNLRSGVRPHGQNRRFR